MCDVGKDDLSGMSEGAASAALSLTVADDLNDSLIRGAYKGALPGLIRPHLKWTTQPIR
jgi:hypothetical protein